MWPVHALFVIKSIRTIVKVEALTETIAKELLSYSKGIVYSVLRLWFMNMH